MKNQEDNNAQKAKTKSMNFRVSRNLDAEFPRKFWPVKLWYNNYLSGDEYTQRKRGERNKNNK
jgi:hypothetical protein